MRTLGVLAILLTASIAHADRHAVWWLGGTFAGTSLSNETQNDPSFNGGARLTLSFEDPALAAPGTNLFDHEARLVPELFAGFYLDDIRVRGQLGVGVRAEWWLVRGGSARMRTALYTAARAKLSGPDAKPGAEFVIGEYLIGDNKNRRFGWEGGLGLIKRPDLTNEQSPELEALVNVYVGWE